jgi:hypothetical protein
VQSILLPGSSRDSDVASCSIVGAGAVSPMLLSDH